MPFLKTYDLFISHAWKYNEDYYRLEKMLNNTALFKWRNYSVPEHKPLVDPNSQVGRNKLLNLINIQIKPVNCVIILGGMYALHSDWILDEIKFAQKYNKPIIGVYPWGQKKMPLIVQKTANELVGWNSSSIIGAIRDWSI